VVPHEFDTFRRIVLADEELQQRLRSLPEWPAFIAAAIAAAAERGIALTEESILAARNDAVRSWLERWV
jgi:hypothetical protein